MTQAFEFQTVPSIIAEPGASHRLGALLAERYTARSAFVVSDPGIAAAGLLDGALASLEAAGFAVTLFTDVVADPPEAVVLDALAKAKAARADLVIGLGGGSSMDTAKLVALLVRTPAELADIYGVGNAREPRLPLIQIPTTAGTGSEVTPIAIVTTGETTKMGVVSPVLYADMAVLDADLTLGLPRAVTAATGIDAMVHAIEAITSRHKRNPLSDHLALKALALLNDNIITACDQPDNREARQNMLLGALLAGQAFSNAPVGAVHALAYPLGGIFHLSHGLSNSLVLPHVLRFNAEVSAADYARIADVLLPGIGGSDSGKTLALIERLEAIAEATGIERRLTEVGINHNDVPRLAEDAMLQTRLLVNNPREVTLEDARSLYEAAL